jgi:hypothetical protein
MYYSKETFRKAKAMQKRLGLSLIYVPNSLTDTVQIYENLANKETLSIFKSKVKEDYYIVKIGSNDYEVFKKGYQLIEIK